MADRYTAQRNNDASTLGRRLKAWVVGETELPDDTKGVCFNADGTADITNDDDSTEAGVPVIKMQPMWTVPKKVTAMSGATKCYRIV